MCDNEEGRPIVIDNGTTICRAGFAGVADPDTVFPSIIGRPKFSGNFGKHNYVGHGAKHKRGILSLKYPIKHGVISNWDDMESIWHYLFFDELHVDPREHPVILTEASVAPKEMKEKVTEIMFEKFGAPSFCLANQNALSLYATNTITGMVIHSGGGVSDVVPIYEGYPVSHAIQHSDLAGQDITERLVSILTADGHSFKTSSERDIVREMKEMLCYVALDFEQEQSSCFGRETYELPDGHCLSIGRERFQCTEILFQPSILEIDSPGIQEMALKSIGKCDVDIQEDLRDNVILAGGSTFLPGFADRLAKEIAALDDSPLKKMKTIAPQDRRHSAWIGGSMIGALSSFQNLCVSRQEYWDTGARIIHRKRI